MADLEPSNNQNAEALAAEDMIVDAALRQHLLTAVIDALDQYVFADKGAAMQQDLRQRIEGGGYGDIQGAMQLADTLTTQLQVMGQDSHLKVYYSPQPLPDLSPDDEPLPEEIARQRYLSGWRNFDINRVERLAGNVGYLELYGFPPTEFAAETAIAAMQFLTHTQALIVDLRHNGGGAPGMVALLCSYLFPESPPIHLNDLYWRAKDETHQWWTLPYVPGQRYVDKPVYVLTSEETASAAEEFTYNLKQLKRAIVVGETTRGGANPGVGRRIHDHFWMFVPTGRAINPITGENWEGTGVLPDVKVPSELALKTAHLMALEKLLETAQESAFVREIQSSIYRVQQDLNELRKDLIAQLKVKP
ncbi:MAG: S41 family peptidase [Cyanobacteria bacterium P01_A01_bin.123]